MRVYRGGATRHPTVRDLATFPQYKHGTMLARFCPGKRGVLQTRMDTTIFFFWNIVHYFQIIIDRFYLS